MLQIRQVSLAVRRGSQRMFATVQTAGSFLKFIFWPQNGDASTCPKTTWCLHPRLAMCRGPCSASQLLRPQVNHVIDISPSDGMPEEWGRPFQSHPSHQIVTLIVPLLRQSSHYYPMTIMFFDGCPHLKRSSRHSGWFSWPTKQDDFPLDSEGCPWKGLFPGII